MQTLRVAACSVLVGMVSLGYEWYARQGLYIYIYLYLQRLNLRRLHLTVPTITIR